MIPLIRKHLPVILLLLLFSYPAVSHLTGSAVFPVHDKTQQARVFEMAEQLKSGQFPVRMVGNLGYGYGYPLFNFYAPLPYYTGALFYLSGFDLFTATNLMYLAGALLAPLLMYFLAASLSGRVAGIAAAILYLYAPYHAVNIYVRGAVGEYYAYAFLPLFFLGIYWCMAEQAAKKRRGFLLGSVGLAGIFLSHNISGLIISAVSLLLLPIMYFSKHDLKKYLMMVVLGVGLSAFFIFPAFAEQAYTSVDKLKTEGSNFEQHFVTPGQLWDSAWGFAGSGPGLADGMSFKIGKWHILLTLASIILLTGVYISKKMKNSLKFFYLISLVFLIICVLMTLEMSASVYRMIPGFTFIQYPWRFLNFILLFSVILVTGLFRFTSKHYSLFLSAVIISASLIFYPKYFLPQTLYYPEADEFLNTENLRFNSSLISDEYLPEDFPRPSSAEEVYRTPFSGLVGQQAVSVKDTAEHKIYMVEGAGGRLVTSLPFFPGWNVSVDSNKVPAAKIEGKLSFEVPSGKKLIEFRLKDTPVRKVSNSVSFLSLCLLLYLSSGYSTKLWLKKPISK